MRCDKKCNPRTTLVLIAEYIFICPLIIVYALTDKIALDLIPLNTFTSTCVVISVAHIRVELSMRRTPINRAFFSETGGNAYT